MPQRSGGKLLVSLLILSASAVIIALIIFIVVRRGAPGRYFNYTELLMDTDVTLQIFCRNPGEGEGAQRALFDEMERLERLLSYSDPGSEVAAINRAAGGGPVPVSPETAEVVREALACGSLSGGAFDPTIAPLLELWGFHGGDHRVPGAAEIEEARAAVDYRRVEIEGHSVHLPRAGMALDLGGIAKGYIIDRGMDLLTRSGFSHALINAGGDVGIAGPKADGSPWRVGIRHPREGDLIAVIPLDRRGAVVTSGDYERFFEADGVRYHHILDPGTGSPARALVSVTVVAPTAVQADALSTALFVLGPQRALDLVESLPGVEAVLITPQGELLISSGLQDLVERPGGRG